MKRIEAIFRHERLDEVKRALGDLDHAGLTVCEVRGHGVHRGVTERWRGADYRVDLLPKISVVVVVNDHESQDVVDAICAAARTGLIGDGKIFVSDVEEVIRIRTGEVDAAAL